MKSEQAQAYAQLSIAMVLVGSTVVVGKLITGVLPVFVASAFRLGIASLVLVPLLLRIEHKLPALDRRGWLILFLQAFAGNFLFSVFLLYGLRLTSATTSGILTSTTPAVIGLISLLILRERLTPLQGLGILLAVMGILLINVLGAGSSAAGGLVPCWAICSSWVLSSGKRCGRSSGNWGPGRFRRWRLRASQASLAL